MRSIPTLLALALLSSSPIVNAAPTRTTAAEATPQQIELEVVELARDGARKSTVMTLLLADADERRGSPRVELEARTQHGEREATYYMAKVQSERTAAGTRFAVEVKRAGNPEFNHADLHVEVARVLRIGAPTLLGKVLRPDGSALTVTATLR